MDLNITQYHSFYITNKGFYDKKDMEITRKIIDKYNPFPGGFTEEKEQELYNKLLWKSKLKREIAKNPIGKVLVNAFDFVKYKFN